MTTHNGRPKKLDLSRLWERMIEQGQATREDIEWRKAEVERQAVEAEGVEEKPDQGKALPPIVFGGEIAHKAIELPEELIEGMLHRGAKMVLGGGSKSFKTWCLADLAISIASGRDWWGHKVKKGKVLYLNLEVQSAFFFQRLQAIAHAKGCSVPQDLGIWNLRGYCADHRTLLPALCERLAGDEYLAIILDPTYKIMAGSENAQEEVAALMDSIEKMAMTTGAAVIFGSHFAKGNAAGKEAIDRISGSGVFARDPDAILTMTRHEEEGAFVIDPILRNCPPVEPFVVRWDFPLMKSAPDLDVAKLKEVGRTAKKPLPTPAEVREVLESAGRPVEGGDRSSTGLVQLIQSTFKLSRADAKTVAEAAVKAEEVREEKVPNATPQGGGQPKKVWVANPHKMYVPRD